MKNKKYYLIIVAVIVVLGIGFLVNGQFLQGALRKSIPPAPPIPTVDVKVDGSDSPAWSYSEAEMIEISWTSQNATVCNFANESYSGPRAVNGSMLSKAGELIEEEAEFNGVLILSLILNCTGPGGMASDTVEVFIK